MIFFATIGLIAARCTAAVTAGGALVTGAGTIVGSTCA